jgi:hypothetical protein
MSADVVSAIGTVTAAVVSVLALVAAARSAAAAEKSAQTASATLRRSAVRDLSALCHEVISENLRVIDLGPTLKSEYNALFTLAGSAGGSRETTLQTALDEDLNAAESLSIEATALGDDLGKLHAASDDDLDQMSTRLMRARTRLRAIRESIELQLTQTRSELQELRSERR